MKVIVQDLETGSYLSADGRWVEDQADARDFLTLMRAYNFARDNTSKHFRVLLHSPDDQYCSSIIDGMGLAVTNAEEAVPPVKIPIAFDEQNLMLNRARHVCSSRYRHRFDSSEWN
jgi:hypothetical protein